MEMWMLGGVFALVGVPMVWLAQRTFARDRAIARWPRAAGVVTSSRLAISTERHRDNDGYDREYTVYKAVVCYTYSVDGQTLDGARIARNADFGSRASAQRCVDKYPEQSEVMVLYQPGDPKEAYLEVRRSTGAVILFAFGCLWFALGGLLVALSFLA